MATQQIHWGATGSSTQFAGSAANYSFVQGPAYNITRKITAIRIRMALGTTITSLKIFIIDAATQEILHISDPVTTFVDETYKAAVCDTNMILTAPFRIGFAPLDGAFGDNKILDPADVVTPYSDFGTAFTYASLSIGATWTGPYHESSRSFGSQVEYEDSVPTYDYTDIRQVNWNPPSGGGNTIAANAYQNSFIQSQAYSTYEGLITKVEAKIHPTSTMGSTRIFLMNAITNEVVYVSGAISVPTSKIVECYPNITLSAPFKVGLAPLTGNFYGWGQGDPGEILPQGVQSGTPSYSVMTVGSIWSLTTNYSSYSFASRVSFQVTRGPVNYDGDTINLPKQGVRSSDDSGIVLTASQPGSRGHDYSGRQPSIKLGIKELRLCDGRRISLLQGTRNNKQSLGCNITELSEGVRNYRHFEGIAINPPRPTSNAEYKYDLLITPTHQHKSANVSLNLSRKDHVVTPGQYSISVGNNNLVGFYGADQDINNISLSINPSQLEFGVNKGKVNFKYPDGSKDYIDFDILKEEVKRSSVERLFRYYDGGYSGSKTDASVIYKDIYPCFLVPDATQSTVIKTTDYTSISLQKYNEIQGVNVGASGAKILVSFNKGITWKSYIDSSWQTVDISNIANQGMTSNTINGITLAQWSGIFTATSLDFAIYLDNAISNYADYNAKVLKGSYTGTTSYQYLYPSTGYRISDVTYYLRGTGGSTTTFPNDYAMLYGYLASDPATLILSEASSSSSTMKIGTFTFPQELDYRNYLMYYKGSSNPTCSLSAVYEAPLMAYLKSINIQITPNLKTGYAFIM